MTVRLRRIVLTAHVASSVGSLGAVAGFLALAIAGLSSQDPQLVRSAYIGMDLIVWYVIVPLVFASLVTGLIQSLGTTWGLFRHYWILVKFLLTVIIAIVLLLQLEGIGYVASLALQSTSPSIELLGLQRSIRSHAIGGLLVLFVPLAVSLYKPRGMTRYGWRKQHTVRA